MYSGWLIPRPRKGLNPLKSDESWILHRSRVLPMCWLILLVVCVGRERYRWIKMFICGLEGISALPQRIFFCESNLSDLLLRHREWAHTQSVAFRCTYYVEVETIHITKQTVWMRWYWAKGSLSYRGIAIIPKKKNKSEFHRMYLRLYSVRVCMYIVKCVYVRSVWHKIWGKGWSKGLKI